MTTDERDVDQGMPAQTDSTTRDSKEEQHTSLNGFHGFSQAFRARHTQPVNTVSPIESKMGVEVGSEEGFHIPQSQVFNFGESDSGMPFTGTFGSPIESSMPQGPSSPIAQSRPSEMNQVMKDIPEVSISKNDSIDQEITAINDTQPPQDVVPKKNSKAKKDKQNKDQQQQPSRNEGPNRKQRRAAIQERKAAEKRALLAAEKKAKEKKARAGPKKQGRK